MPVLGKDVVVEEQPAVLVESAQTEGTQARVRLCVAPSRQGILDVGFDLGIGRVERLQFLERRTHYPKNTAGPQDPMGLREKVEGSLKRHVLDHVLGENHVHALAGKRQGAGDVLPLFVKNQPALAVAPVPAKYHATLAGRGPRQVGLDLAGAAAQQGTLDDDLEPAHQFVEVGPPLSEGIHDAPFSPLRCLPARENTQRDPQGTARCSLRRRPPGGCIRGWLPACGQAGRRPPHAPSSSR